MDLHRAFLLSMPAAEAWRRLRDLERVAPCLPGARLEGIQLDELDGDRYSGFMTVQAGPVSASFRGQVRVRLRDDDRRRLVLEAGGRHLGGDGAARATVDAVVSPVGADQDRAQVDVDITLDFAGPVGRLDWDTHARIAGTLVERFAACVDQLGPEDGGAPLPATGPLDLVAVAGPSLRRLAMAVLAVGLLVGGGVSWTRRRRRRWGKMTPLARHPGGDACRSR